MTGSGGAIRSPLSLLLLAIAVAACAMAAPARAAGPSFECAKAMSDEERQICADPHLAQEDLDVATAYKAALAAAGNDQAIRTRLRDEQRSWLGWRNICGYQDCLGISMPRRISLLRSLAKTPALAGHLRTVLVRRKAGTVFAAYPTVDDGSPAAAAFNRAMRDAVEGEIADHGGNEFSCPKQVAVCPSMSVIAELFLPAPHILSVQISTWGFYGEPFETFKTINFDMGRGRALTVADVFGAADWKPALTAYCVKELNDGADPPGDDPSSDIGKLGNWRFEPGRAVVGFTFGRELGHPHYFAAPIPDSVLARYLKPDSPVGRSSD